MNQDLEKPITMKDLGEFTEQTLLPAMQDMINVAKKELRQEINELGGEIDSLRNAMTNMAEIQKRILESIERIEVRQDKERTEAKIINWLCQRVDILEKKLGVIPTPIPRE